MMKFQIDETSSNEANNTKDMSFPREIFNGKEAAEKII